MSASTILEHARSLGILLTARAGKLRYEAPLGTFTAELRERLLENKAEILDVLEAERLASRRVVKCQDCIHHILPPAETQNKGTSRALPGGCSQGRTSSLHIPPIYPFTNWYCDGWTARRTE